MNHPADAGPKAAPFPKPLRLKKLWPGFAVALLALGCIPFAVPLYHTVFNLLIHLPLQGFYSAATQIPSALIFGLILASIAVLQPKRRPAIIVFLIALGISSLINETIKYTTCRARPKYSVLLGSSEKLWIVEYRQTHPGTRIRAEKVDQWLGPRRDHPAFKDGYSSFPSGHANSSFVMAAFLSVLYPQGRVIWYLAAASCGVARVEKTRHWPEDVLFGGALGWTIAQLVFSWRWPVRFGVGCVALLVRLANRLRGLRTRRPGHGVAP